MLRCRGDTAIRKTQGPGTWPTCLPPHQIFQHRPQAQNPRLGAFGATTTLAFVKEIDPIQSRRSETRGAPRAINASGNSQPRPACQAEAPTLPSQAQGCVTGLVSSELFPGDAPPSPVSWLLVLFPQHSCVPICAGRFYTKTAPLKLLLARLKFC